MTGILDHLQFRVRPGLYKDIRAKAPNARIIVLGYPQALSLTGTCPVIDLDTAKRTAMNGLADALADGTPAERLGQTMGAAELGRELGDAGGPLLVAAVASGTTLTHGYGALAVLIALAAAAVAAVSV